MFKYFKVAGAALSIIFTLLLMSAVPVQNSLSDFILKLQAPYISLYGSYSSNPDTFRVVKFGYNLGVDAAAPEDIWSYGGQMTYTSASQTLNIVSSSTDDDTGGTGATGVLVTGLGSDGLTLEEIVPLDGTSTVTTTGEFMFVNRMVVYYSGTGLKNAGNITASQTTSGTVLAYIPTGTGVTQQLMYRVPRDRKCYINNLYVSVDKLSGSSPRAIFLVKVFNPLLTNTEYVVRRELLDSSVESNRSFPNFKDQTLGPDEIINIEVSTTANATEVSGTIDMICVTL